ncbi:hypothetical protein JCM3770_000068 [Rhodotorula araucariae]
MPRIYDPSEPRKPANSVPYRFPASSNSFADLMSFASMLCSGLAMLTRFAIWPWFGLILAISGILGTKSLGTAKSSDQQGMLSGWTSLMFAMTSLMSIYSPIFLGQAVKGDMSWPFGFNKGLVYLPRDGALQPGL